MFDQTPRAFANASSRHSQNPLLKIQELVFGYEEQKPVLNGINLEIAQGEVVGLVGANGSGKTTLFRCITGLEKISSGNIEFEGQSIDDAEDFRRLRSKTGYVLQNSDNQLIFPTVFEDVMFGPLNLGHSQEEAHEIAHEWLKKTGIEGFADRLVANLSGGEKKLVAMAGIFAMNPKLLLLDEPLNELDRMARKYMANLLADLPCAKIIATHEKEILERLACKTVLLKNGRIEPVAD